MKRAIIGAGGFGKEIYWSMSPIERSNTSFFVDDSYWFKNNEKIFPLSLFEPAKYEVIVSVANPFHR